MANDVERLYDTDLTDAGWALIAPLLPPARPGGRPRTTNMRAVINAIFYLLRTGCQWRLLPESTRRGAPSITISVAGRTTASGRVFSALYMRQLGSKPAGMRVLPSSSWMASQ